MEEGRFLCLPTNTALVVVEDAVQQTGFRRWDTKGLSHRYLPYQGSLLETPGAPSHLSLPRPFSMSPGDNPHTP